MYKLCTDELLRCTPTNKTSVTFFCALLKLDHIAGLPDISADEMLAAQYTHNNPELQPR